VLEVAKRYAPGHLITAEAAGLVAQQVCILSGMRATSGCPSMIEWFVPGSEPQQPDNWQLNGRVTLPPEYAEWSASNVGNIALADATATTSASARILSPLDGDHYQNVPGMDARYSTIPLVATGAAQQVRWFVDDKPLQRARWQLRKGEHVIRASWSSGAQDSIRVVVE
jgi:membrane carboxypeptidase/penicillin-binding protein PbpC